MKRAVAKWLPLILIAWPAFCVAVGEWRIEHIVLGFAIAILAYGTPAMQRLFRGLFPFCLLALIYDSMRYWHKFGVTAARVHLCDLRALELRLFGFEGETASDWFQAHSSPFFDRLCAVPYGTFIFVSLAVGAWLYFRDYDALCRFAWTFLLVNIAGFITYHAYPAAPPWYFHSHGCFVDLSTTASAGPNLARVDTWLGVPYFAGFYGRSADVFGAVPSLHVAYPLLNLIFGWRYWQALGRSLAVAFFLLMCVSAVYLDHHWVIDVLIGITYTATISFCVNALWRGKT